MQLERYRVQQKVQVPDEQQLSDAGPEEEEELESEQ
jgi:hypothetical protein